MSPHSLGFLAENPTADFSNDTGWVVLLKAVLIFAFCVVSGLLGTGFSVV